MSMTTIRRPFGVSLIAVLLIISGILDVVGGIVMLAAHATTSSAQCAARRLLRQRHDTGDLDDRRRRARPPRRVRAPASANWARLLVAFVAIPTRRPLLVGARVSRLSLVPGAAADGHLPPGGRLPVLRHRGQALLRGRRRLTDRAGGCWPCRLADGVGRLPGDEGNPGHRDTWIRALPRDRRHVAASPALQGALDTFDDRTDRRDVSGDRPGAPRWQRDDGRDSRLRESRGVCCGWRGHRGLV